MQIIFSTIYLNHNLFLCVTLYPPPRSRIGDLKNMLKIILIVSRAEALTFLWDFVIHFIILKSYERQISEMTLRKIKRTSELARPSFAFAPRVHWIFFMWLVATAAIFVLAVTLGAFAKASAKIRESSRLRNGVGAENKWNKVARRKKSAQRGRFYEAKLCAKRTMQK